MYMELCWVSWNSRTWATPLAVRMCAETRMKNNQINVCRINRPKMIKRCEMSGLKYASYDARTHISSHSVPTNKSCRIFVDDHVDEQLWVSTSIVSQLIAIHLSQMTKGNSHLLAVRQHEKNPKYCWMDERMRAGLDECYHFYFDFFFLGASDFMIYYWKVRPSQVRRVQFVDTINTPESLKAHFRWTVALSARERDVSACDAMRLYISYLFGVFECDRTHYGYKCFSFFE